MTPRPADVRAVESVLADHRLMSAVARCVDWLSARGMNIALSGIDGCGKSTLSHQLDVVLTAARVPARGLHIFDWYRNLLVMPTQMLGNRWHGRHVAVFDRTIHDNIAKFFTGRPHLVGLLPLTS